MKESDAKKKTCPIMTTPVQNSQGYEVVWINCQGSECALWIRSPNQTDGEPLGRCGLRDSGAYMRR